MLLRQSKLNTALVLLVALQSFPALSQTPDTDQRQLNLQRIHNLTDRVLSFDNFQIKVRTLITQADLLWSHDQVYAQQLFTKANELLKTPPAEIPASTLLSLRGFLVQHVARYDRELAGKWASGELLSRPDSFNLALELARQGDYAQAKERAQQGFEGQLTGLRKLLEVVTFLQKIRTHNPATADALFSELLSKMSVDSSVVPNDLLMVGNYLFTNSSAPTSPQAANLVFIGPAKVGAVSLMADISVDRTGLSIPTVKNYLATATEILARSFHEEAEQSRAWAVAYVLMKKAQIHAPELVDRLAILAARTGLDLSATKEVATPGPPAPAPQETIEEVLKTLEAVTNVIEHDQRAAKLVSRFCGARNVNNARRIAESVRDLALRSHLLSFVLYFEVAQDLESGNSEPAEKAVGKLDAPLQRSLTLLNLGQHYLKRGDLKTGDRLINESVKQAIDLKPPQAASLNLVAVELLGRYDSFAALRLFKEAARWLSQTDVLPLQHHESIKVGNQTTMFNLSVRNLSYGSLRGAVQLIGKVDPQNTTLALLEIKNEAMLSSGITALTAVFLKEFEKQ